MNPSSLTNLLCQLSQKLNATQMRACVFLEGSEHWQIATCKAYLDFFNDLSGFWVGEHSPFLQAQNLAPQQARHLLGQETDFAIFSAREGIDPNTLGIVSGMIRAGGLCFILLPERHIWLKQGNLACQKYLSSPFELADSLKGFNQFLWQKLSQHAIHLPQQQAVQRIQPWLNHPDLSAPIEPTRLPTSDQINGIEKIHHVVFGHRKRPLIITADRGRGKSSLLGLAAIELIQQGKQNIVFTAARKDQVKQALKLIEEAGLIDKVRFQAPDQLLSNPLELDILMVDEAAHLPLPILESLLKRYHRMVFATTQQGYEGSGRGFNLKFNALLDQYTPGWKNLTLNTPIRWQAKDWLEKTINQTLLLNQAKPPSSNTALAPFSVDSCHYRIVPVAELLEKPKLLESLFELLVSAHYQTSANDLMQLLETPNLRILVATHHSKVLGALVSIEEGNLSTDPMEGSAVKRQQGHLFPQLMYKQTNRTEWLELRTLRIMRIAVDTTHQNKQIGSQLLKHLEHWGQNNGFDSLSTSFGATADLVRFWQQNRFEICGLGVKRDKASGTFSLHLTKSLTEAAQQLEQENFPAFLAQIHFSFLSSHQSLAPDVLLAILKMLPHNGASHPADFPAGYLNHQPYENVSFALRNWALNCPAFFDSLADTALQKRLVRKLIQNTDWADLICPEFPSKKAIETQFKQAMIKFETS